MMKNLNKTSLSIAILCAGISTVHAAALDRAGQSISAFLQDGNYAEASLAVLDADVSGKIRPRYAIPGTDSDTGQFTNSSTYYNAALKLQLTPQFSFGLIYDQPFGADIGYPQRANGTFSGPNGGTSAEVKTQNLSFLFGYQPNQNWNFYAAPVYQTIEGSVELHGNAFSTLQGYKQSTSEDHAIGWLAGAAYRIPEIHFLASLTYRSEIDHKAQSIEEFPVTVPPALIALVGQQQSETTTPQSVNLDIRTAINPSTVVYANTRWVNWKKFNIQPYQFGAVTKLAMGHDLKLVQYDKDQISVDVGLARKFNDQWSGVVSAAWDSGAGNPASLLGPIEGYTAVGLGLQFNPAPNYFLQGGVKYFWLGDAIGHSSSFVIPGMEEIAKVADYSDNTAIGYMLKMGYRF